MTGGASAAAGALASGPAIHVETLQPDSRRASIQGINAPNNFITVEIGSASPAGTGSGPTSQQAAGDSSNSTGHSANGYRPAAADSVSSVHDLSNLQIVSPRTHNDIHYRSGL
ncbi:hypothetical protein ACVWWJ_001873 [Luteibacter sp. HA06]